MTLAEPVDRINEPSPRRAMLLDGDRIRPFFLASSSEIVDKPAPESIMAVTISCCRAVDKASRKHKLTTLEDSCVVKSA